MRLDEAVAKIKEKFPKAIDIGNPEKINQNGLFLYFDGTTPSDLSTDIAHFVLLLAGNSLTSKADDSVINELIRLRKGVLEIGTSFNWLNPFFVLIFLTFSPIFL